MSGESTAQSHFRRDWLAWFAGGLTVLVLVVFLIIPIFQTMAAAFFRSNAPHTLDNFTLNNFERFFYAATYRSAFINSLIVSCASALIATLLALPAAFALARVQIPFRNLILALSVVPLVAPPFIGAYSWVVLLGRNGILTKAIEAATGLSVPSIYGLFGVILAMAVSHIPYAILIIQGSLSASDPYIEESAHVMGASRWRILTTITLPLVTPSIAAAAMIVFIKALGNFGVPAILGGEMYVLPTLIYFQIHGFFNLSGAAAIAFVNVLITLVAIGLLASINRGRRFVTVTGVTRKAARIDGLAARAWANVYIWSLLFLMLLPQIVVVWFSFAERWAGTTLPTVYGFGHYRQIAGSLLQPIINSLELAGAATVMAVVFGTLLAYVSVRKRFAGKWALDLTIVLPFVLPGVVTGVAFLVTFNDDPLVLTGTGLIIVLAYFVRRITYVFRSVSASMTQLDPKIEEASMVCGATWATTMRRVTIPLVAPGVLAGGIIVFATLLSEMNVTILLYSAGWKTIAIAIYERLVGDELPVAAAIGSVTIVLTLALVFVSSRLIGRNMADMFK